ncbi:MAG: UvrD-helicase domain-containing protein [Phycisphaerae bacterium]|nr:UvrD-helicase domain-containing protein [Phycisphaerae bacterium]
MQSGSTTKPDDLLSDLTPPQAEAVRHKDGPLLVLAGAGSGKTRTITRRVAYLARTGVNPRHILAITFTNKAANEMRERIAATGVARGATVCTFHSLCARLLREYAEAAGLASTYSIFDQSDRLKVIREAVAKAELAADNFTPSNVEPAISRAKNELKTAETFAAEASEWSARTIARIYTAYEKLMAEQNGLDFDDLLMRTALLLRNDEQLRDELEDRFRYVLIDEYQDTNHAQYVIARELTRKRQNLCATGDPDQSIYAWRGADISNIMDFERDYPDAKVVRLEQNYRSTKAILSAASELISANRMRKRKGLWTENPEGDKVRVMECQDAEDEAEFVAETITEMRRDRSLSDFAIFYRVNAMTRVLEEALRREGIAYQIARGVEFYSRKEIKDALAYLRVIVNPADEVALLRIINEPTRGIGKTSVDRLVAQARASGKTVLETAGEADKYDVLKRASGKIKAFAEMVRRWQSQPLAPVRPILEDMLLDSGMQAELDKAGVDSDQAANVAELITAAAEYDDTHEDGGLAEWLQEISLVSDVDGIDDSVGSVTLMTLHAAKGLEFPVVFIIGLEDGLLPHGRATIPGAEPDEMEEERRLCFVGMTRAREVLTLSRARYRMLRGVTERMTKSRFLEELPRGEILSESRQRDDEDDFNEWSQAPAGEFSRLRAGQLIRHPMFGFGRLLWVDPLGQRTRAGVRFNTGVEKTLVLEYAKIEVIKE